MEDAGRTARERNRLSSSGNKKDLDWRLLEPGVSSFIPSLEKEHAGEVRYEGLC